MFGSLGLAEIAVIAVVGLLIFGPDRLPQAVRTLSTTLRNLRGMASDATRSLQEASGMDEGETKQIMGDIAELHPKRLAAGVLDDAATPARPSRTRPAPDSTADRRPEVVDLDPDLP